jgi:hypothetical protein
VIDIESLADFDTHIGKTRHLNGWFLQSVDLRERTQALRTVDPRGAVFLGCQFAPSVEHELRRSGALLFPRLPDLPFDPDRAQLYDATELYGAGRLRHKRRCGGLCLVALRVGRVADWEVGHDSS